MAEILNFQGSTHRIGVGSLSIILNDNLKKYTGIGITDSKMTAIVYSVSWITIFSIISIVMYYLNKKKQEKIDKQLDDEE